MLLNLSNVPFTEWGKLQADTAIKEFESVRDVEFPIAEGGIDESNIKDLVDQCISENQKYFNNADRNNAVYIYGDEFFTFYFVKSMLDRGFRCITPQFNGLDPYNKNAPSDTFIKFREYKFQY